MSRALAPEPFRQVPIKRLRWKDRRNVAMLGDEVIGIAQDLDADPESASKRGSDSTPEQVDQHEAELRKQGKQYEFHWDDGAGKGNDGWFKLTTWWCRTTTRTALSRKRPSPSIS